MSTCPLLRMSLTRSSERKAKPAAVNTTANARVSHRGNLWLGILLSVAGLAGLYQLQQVLNALPDSNEDFIYF
jgi:hypothetical protein